MSASRANAKAWQQQAEPFPSSLAFNGWPSNPVWPPVQPSHQPKVGETIPTPSLKPTFTKTHKPTNPQTLPQTHPQTHLTPCPSTRPIEPTAAAALEARAHAFEDRKAAALQRRAHVWGGHPGEPQLRFFAGVFGGRTVKREDGGAQSQQGRKRPSSTAVMGKGFRSPMPLKQRPHPRQPNSPRPRSSASQLCSAALAAACERMLQFLHVAV